MNIKNGKEKMSRQKKQPVKPASDRWELRLYVAGASLKAETAFKNIRLICEDKLKGKYHIKVIDLSKNPQLARLDQILAIPTLVRKLPKPVRNIIGDLSNTEGVLVGLDIIEHNALKPG